MKLTACHAWRNRPPVCSRSSLGRHLRVEEEFVVAFGAAAVPLGVVAEFKAP
jgi:hypothetical protein